MPDENQLKDELTRFEAKVGQIENAFCETCNQNRSHVWTREAGFSAIGHHRRFFLQCETCETRRDEVAISYQG